MNRLTKKVVLFFHHYMEKPRTCPICSWRGRQFSLGGGRNKRRFDCTCPQCGSCERQRLAYMVATNFCKFNYSNVLHIAPEQVIAEFLKKEAINYLSIDLNESAMVQMDVTNLRMADQSISLIWCSHVLEHVEDDQAAINEFYRVLSPKGCALIQVPIWKRTTYEDWTKVSAKERFEHFFQEDHVRLYGHDIINRFTDAGFLAKEFSAQDFGPEKLLTFGLSFASTNEVFIFSKP